MTTPRGIRNKNPGNIEATAWTQAQPGYAGTESQGRFATFDTMAHGMGALLALLRRYRNTGTVTVKGIIGKWAPPSENDTGAYIASVAKRIGVNSDTPLPDDSAPYSALAWAIAEFECGHDAAHAAIPDSDVAAAVSQVYGTIPLTPPTWSGPVINSGGPTAPIVEMGQPDPESPIQPQYPVNPDGQGVPMLPALVLPLLSVLIDKIPEITALFGKDVPVADRNVGLATSVLKVATTALGAANEQEAVQKALDDPASLQKVKDAIQKEWFDQIKGSEATVGTARAFGLSYSQATNVRTVFFKFTFIELFSLLVMTMAAAGGGWVLYADFPGELKGAVVTLMLIGGFTGTKEYWLGTSDGSRSKDETISNLAK